MWMELMELKKNIKKHTPAIVVKNIQPHQVYGNTNKNVQMN
uniref:Uncharacterized protein n=1 Tax=viral metagenome TaxID=1070528 RepID=A0A6C0EF17_9ZZZZ